MCGIIGYTGTKNARDILISGLYSLEYRGYDSAGVAFQDREGNITTIKSVGKVSKLENKLKNIQGTSCGIGHTRWATHGKPTETNAHPHSSNNGNVSIIHNGIIENFAELKAKLTKKGYIFKSDTDSEVLANLIDYYQKKYTKPLDALARVCLRVVGSYAVCILFKSEPETIYCLKKDSPLVIAKTKDGVVVASDVQAITPFASSVVYAENNEMIRVTKEGFEFYTIDQDPIKKQEQKVDSLFSFAGKNGYSHFMLKEIYEQPQVSKNVVKNYIKNGKININIPPKSCILACRQIFVVACGSAYNAGLVGSKEIEEKTKIPTRVFFASEFRYSRPAINKTDIAIFVSQSGETADTLLALRQTKQMGIKTIAIVNVPSSSIAREADFTLHTQAGVEIAVATTKAYFAQILVFHFLALKMAEICKKTTNNYSKRCIFALNSLFDKTQKALALSRKMQHAANKYFNHKNVFFLGRGVDYLISQEANLKLKEISYIHSEAYAAGELKHGTISLIDENSLVVGIATASTLAPKTLSNLIEAKSRGAKVIVFTSLGKKMFRQVADEIFCLPSTNKYLQPLLTIIPLQLFAYHTALARGCDVDKPRNLAKSVTVE